MAWTTPSTFTAGSVLTAAQLNTNVRDNTNALYTTVQRIAFTQRSTQYNVSATAVASAPDVFTGGGSTGSALTWTADGTSAYVVEFFCPYAFTGTDIDTYLVTALVNGSGTELGRLGALGFVQVAGKRSAGAIHSKYFYTPAAGSTTINVRAYAVSSNGGVAALSAGAGGAGNLVPMYLAVFGPSLS